MGEMMKIDVHSHAVFTESFGKAGRFGPEVVNDNGTWKFRVGPYEAPLPAQKDGRARDPVEEMRSHFSPEAIVKKIDAKGVDMIGLTISPLLYLYWAEPDIGVPFARLQNDLM